MEWWAVLITTNEDNQGKSYILEITISKIFEGRNKHANFFISDYAYDCGSNTGASHLLKGGQEI
jgi:hypothetical protein